MLLLLFVALSFDFCLFAFSRANVVASTFTKIHSTPLGLPLTSGHWNDNNNNNDHLANKPQLKCSKSHVDVGVVVAAAIVAATSTDDHETDSLAAKSCSPLCSTPGIDCER